MLRLVLGTAGTGKTKYVLENIKQRAKSGKHSVFIVPEQFSSTAEGIVYTELGDELSGYVRVTSFSGYAERILRMYGGVAEQTITDAARVVLVRRALNKLGDTLPQLYKLRRSIAFCALCADTIKELKTAGCKASDLARLSAGSENEEKLSEISLVFGAYEAIIAHTALDPVDRITRAAERIDVEDLQNIAVFVDNFDGFTYPEYRLLDKLLQAQDCTVTLCCDGISDNDNGLGLFSPVKDTAARLRALAGKKDVKIAAITQLSSDYRHKKSPMLEKAAKILEGIYDENEKNADTDGIYLESATGKYDECKLVAAHIKRKVNDGVPYGKMAIICRIHDDYKAALCYELRLACIPYFMDESYTLERCATASLLRAGLALAVGGITAEGILRFLKTGLSKYNDLQLSMLENYVYTWRLNGKDFKSPFTLSPSGFGSDKDGDAEIRVQLEAMRADIMAKIDVYMQEIKTESAAEIARAVYNLIISFGADAKLLSTAAELKADGEVVVAERLVASWNEVMNLLSQMEQLLGDGNVTVSEYDELFLLLLRSSEIGAVPQTQNAVIVTSADRMRLEEPKVCFLLGVSEGTFPKEVGYSGLLTHADRELLVKGGIEMPGNFETRSLLEQMFFYKAATAAQSEVYFSYIPPVYGGAPMSAPLQILHSALHLAPHSLTLAQRASSAFAAVDILSGQYHDESVNTATLREAILRDKYEADSIYAMDRAANQREYCLDKKGLIHDLLGDKLRISPTRVEQYYTCSFAYFLQYILGIRARKRAEMSPLESGTLIHYILEKALSEAGGDFVEMSDEQLCKIASNIADEYINKNMPDATSRFRELVKKIKASVTRLLIYLRQEQEQSSFHPVAFEQSIGEDGLKPITLTTALGEKIDVVGKIDRIDVMYR
ncbi:MAG: PD-(D/E)XK nuclease family protein, partial [Oscillospiraceae bacterium]